MTQFIAILDDITRLDVDIVVNAANSSLLGGGGVDGAIHRVAGPELLLECRGLHGCAVGEAKLTKGYGLKAKYIIHTVGPVYSGNKEAEVLLKSCYINSLNLAFEHPIKSIAFPAISCGVYGYPYKLACAIAVDTCRDYLAGIQNGITLYFYAFDEQLYSEYERLISASC